MDIYSHHRVWHSSPYLAVFSQKRPRTGIAEGLQVKIRSLAKCCEEVCAVPVYVILCSHAVSPLFSWIQKSSQMSNIYIMCECLHYTWWKLSCRMPDTEILTYSRWGDHLQSKVPIIIAVFHGISQRFLLLMKLKKHMYSFTCLTGAMEIYIRYNSIHKQNVDFYFIDTWCSWKKLFSLAA